MEHCVELGLQDNFLGGIYFCVRKSVFEELEGFSDILGIAEDWDFLARLVLSGYDFDVIPKALYFYRIRSLSRFQTTWSYNSKQTLRKRLIEYASPDHSRTINNLLLETISENQRLRSAAWNLDRKIVKIALKLSDIISEKRRIAVENAVGTIFSRLKSIQSRIKRRLKREGEHAHKFYPPVVDERTILPPGLVKERQDSIERIKRKSPFASEAMSIKSSSLDVPMNRPLFGFAGKLTEEGCPLGFLRLAYWMRMSNDDSYFVMMGDGELAAEVKAAQKALELDNFIWFQSRPVSEEFYGILSGLVITALSGDEPVEMYQALGFGVPVFSADVGKARTTLGQYGGGLVVHHDPKHKDFADCFYLWKSNVEIYKSAAVETAGLIRKRYWLA